MRTKALVWGAAVVAILLLPGKAWADDDYPEPPSQPFGAVDVIEASGAAIRAGGWAIDPDTSDPIEVQLSIDGHYAGSTTANINRPDVGNAYPGYGGYHGYDLTLPAADGPHNVCVYAVYQSASAQLGCRDVTVRTRPYGYLDMAEATASGIHAGGWAIDPDTAAPIQVEIYVDNRYAGATTANINRPDVGAANPGYGSNHGFDVTVPFNVGDGPHTVCAVGVNVGAGSGNQQLTNCKNVTVSNLPFGFLDVAEVTQSGVRAGGWTIDPNTTGPIDVHVYIDGAFAGATTANINRVDVGNAYPAYGPNHGYDITIPNRGAGHTVCVYAINAGPGSGNPLLGCKNV